MEVEIIASKKLIRILLILIFYWRRILQKDQQAY